MILGPTLPCPRDRGMLLALVLRVTSPPGQRRGGEASTTVSAFAHRSRRAMKQDQLQVVVAKGRSCIEGWPSCHSQIPSFGARQAAGLDE